jgi:hypothetical protein
VCCWPACCRPGWDWMRPQAFSPWAGTGPERPVAAQDPVPPQQPPQSVTGPAPSPWANPGFRRLLAIFMVNGVAAAIPATLLPFFVADRLQARNRSRCCCCAGAAAWACRCG